MYVKRTRIDRDMHAERSHFSCICVPCKCVGYKFWSKTSNNGNEKIDIFLPEKIKCWNGSCGNEDIDEV